MDIASNLRALVDQKQYKSAELLGLYAISNKKIGANAEVLALFADALYGTGQYARALNYYKQALSSPTLVTIRKIENDVKEKCAMCYINIKDEPSAASILETIPSNARTVSANMSLGRLYHYRGIDKLAIPCYKEALRQNPFAMEAVLALVEMGQITDPDFVNILHSVSSQSLTPQTPQTPAPVPTNATSTISTIPLTTARAYAAQIAQDGRKAIDLWAKLNEVYPENVWVLENRALSHILADDHDKAIACFQRIRQKGTPPATLYQMYQIDPYYMGSMDVYANLLRSIGNMHELNRLGHELLCTSGVTGGSPECWTSVAMYVPDIVCYSEAKGARDKALVQVERAISIAPRHLCAYIIKGDLLMAGKSPEIAVTAYRRAFMIRPSLVPASGLVNAYIAQGQLKEALVVAKDATQRWPESYRTKLLFGKVLTQTPEARGKARKILMDALAANPRCMDTIFAMVNLNIAEAKYDEAVEMLKTQLKFGESDIVYTQLAEIATLQQNYQEALAYFHHALGLNPTSELATLGIQRLEARIKGKDPDASDSLEDAENTEESEGEEAYM